MNALTSGATISSKGGSSAFSNISGYLLFRFPADSPTDNLPFRSSVVGSAFDEAGFLRLAYAYEQANSWYERHPRLLGKSGQTGEFPFFPIKDFLTGKKGFTS